MYTTKQFKDSLREGRYYDGGYPKYFICDDGEALSYEAALSEYKQIIWAMRNKVNNGWRIVGEDVNYEDQYLFCAHTGKRIDPAYELE